mmetsp:Transcript_4950/g.7607  ORF Transcript_4950/g.7607 Transcript_4950/m.7607 type:complete len:83 (-) Transcript_4950:655-903(-)
MLMRWRLECETVQDCNVRVLRFRRDFMGFGRVSREDEILFEICPIIVNRFVSKLSQSMFGETYDVLVSAQWSPLAVLSKHLS